MRIIDSASNALTKKIQFQEFITGINHSQVSDISVVSREDERGFLE